MNAHGHLIRFLVVASLTASFLSGGLVPLAGVQGAALAQVKRQAGQPVCCCIGDGSCCGKACCAMPSQPQQPAGMPLRAPDKNRHPLVLVGLEAPALCASTEPGANRPAGAPLVWEHTPLPTLQAQHIRIQT